MERMEERRSEGRAESRRHLVGGRRHQNRFLCLFSNRDFRFGGKEDSIAISAFRRAKKSGAKAIRSKIQTLPYETLQTLLCSLSHSNRIRSDLTGHKGLEVHICKGREFPLVHLPVTRSKTRQCFIQRVRGICFMNRSAVSLFIQ